MTTNRHVLILEDNPAWAKSLKADLCEKGFKATLCAANVKDLLKTIPAKDQYEVLVDLGMNLHWLAGLGDEVYSKKLRRGRFWIITGAVDVDVAYLRKRYRHIPFEERWFDKLDMDFLDELNDELSTPHSDSHDEDTPWSSPRDLGWLRNYPNPIRAVDRSGNVLWTNKGWAANPYTPALRPSELESAFEAPALGKWSESRRRGPLPVVVRERLPHAREGYTSVTEYLLREQVGLDGSQTPYLMQWIVPLDMGSETSLGDMIAGILKDLTRHLFSRARFYRIDPLEGTDGTITLEHQEGGIASNAKLPIRRLLGGQILERVRAYAEQTRGVQTLVCDRFEEHGYEKDAEWQTWNNIIGFDGARQSLGVPILDRHSDLGIAGVLICDCKDKLGLDGRTGYIPPDAEDWLENNLLHAVVQLAHALRKDKQRRLTKAGEQVLEATTPLFNANGRENLEAAILDQAVQLMGAHGGILLAELPNVRSGLEIGVARGEMEHRIAKILPGEIDSLPAIRAWKEKAVVNVPDFAHSGVWREMIEADVLRHLTGPMIDEEDLRHWFSGLGSVLAAPLRRGERVMGAVTLHHADAMHFDDGHSHCLRRLLEIAAPILEAELESEDRNIWHEEVIHRLGSRINSIASNLELLDLLDEEHWEQQSKQARTQARVLRDLVRRLRDEDHVWDRDGSFRLDWRRRIERIEDKFLGGREGCGREVQLQETSFPRELVLAGDPDAFDMVLEDLLSNACIHSDGFGPILLSVKADNGILRVRISNPGSISKADQEILFRIERRCSNAKGEGLGMGLALARRAARFHAGEVYFDADNPRADAVSFCVEWPLNTTRDKGTSR